MELASVMETSSPKAFRRFLETFIKRINIYPDGRADIYHFPPIQDWSVLSLSAEGVGFEPTRGFQPPTVFKTVSINRSDTPPESPAMRPLIQRIARGAASVKRISGCSSAPCR